MSVNASTFNTPLEALLDRTAWLKERVDGLATDVQVFTANGTWTKPDHALLVLVYAVGSGGSGGGGLNGLSPAGGGGGGAPLVTHIYPADMLAATEGVQVGASPPAAAASQNGANGQISVFALTKDYALNAAGGKGGIQGGAGGHGGAGFCGGGGGGNGDPGGRGANGADDAVSPAGGGTAGESVPLFLRSAVPWARPSSRGEGGAVGQGGRGGLGYGAGGGGGPGNGSGGGGGGAGWIFKTGSGLGGGGDGGTYPSQASGPGNSGIVVVVTIREVP